VRKGGIVVCVPAQRRDPHSIWQRTSIFREVVYTGVSGRLMFETWRDCMEIIKTPGFYYQAPMGGTYKLEDLSRRWPTWKAGKSAK
jgi:threonine 3-dehydrogenase